jgi:hypothetical protein
VQFGSVASTLVVKPHAVFNGQVAANASVYDALKLSGVQPGTADHTRHTVQGLSQIGLYQWRRMDGGRDPGGFDGHMLSIEGFARDCLIFCVLSHTLLPDRARSRHGQERYRDFLQTAARSTVTKSP